MRVNVNIKLDPKPNTRDKGYKAFMEALRKRGTIEVGVLGELAGVQHKGALRAVNRTNRRAERAAYRAARKSVSFKGIRGASVDRLLERTRRTIERADNVVAASARSRARSAKKKKESPTVATIASRNEFGYTPPGYSKPTNPARPFIRGWYDSNKGRTELAKLQRALMQRRIKGVEDLDSSLKKLGVYAVGAIKKFIADGVPPPNNQVTKDRKGSSKPLIATGQMRNSITYRIKNG